MVHSPQRIVERGKNKKLKMTNFPSLLVTHYASLGKDVLVI